MCTFVHVLYMYTPTFDTKLSLERIAPQQQKMLLKFVKELLLFPNEIQLQLQGSVLQYRTVKK